MHYEIDISECFQPHRADLTLLDGNKEKFFPVRNDSRTQTVKMQSYSLSHVHYLLMSRNSQIVFGPFVPAQWLIIRIN